MLLLSVDTSGNTCSAAVTQEDRLLGCRMLYNARSHSQILLPMAKQLLAVTGHTIEEVDAFAAANGPGSYTGLRIGVAAIQALAFAGQKPCVGISTLEGLAWNLVGTRGILCAALHARQNLLYTALFSSDGKAVTRLTSDAVLEADAFAQQLAAYAEPVTVIGSGMPYLLERCGHVIAAPMHLREQLACGIAMAARHTPFGTAETLTVQYLQPVKIG